jgi:8-amino-7-oxononanoate synthase
MDLLDKLQPIASRVAAFDDGEARPFDTVIDDILGPTEVVIGGRRTLMYGSNNYFGLTFHPEVVTAAAAALERFGTGTNGSRVANGTLGLHVALEEDLARAFGKRAASVFSTGYQANLAVVSGLCGREDFVLLDSESHASLYDAARLSGATIVAFKHNSATALRRQLSRLPRQGRNRLVVVEGLYSIRGDLAPLADVVEACREGQAYLLVDEAHSFGVYGDTGLGWCEAEGVLREVDFVVGTFSKCLGNIGGFCVSDHAPLRMLHFSARPYVFTASPTPATVAGVRAALAVGLRDGHALRAALWKNVRRIRTGLAALQYRVDSQESPVVAIPIGGVDRTVAVWRALLRSGLYTNLILPPGCPADECVLRLSVSSAHTDAQNERALDIFERVGRELELGSALV